MKKNMSSISNPKKVENKPPKIIRSLIWISENWKTHKIHIILGIIISLLSITYPLIKSFQNNDKNETVIDNPNSNNRNVTNVNVTVKQEENDSDIFEEKNKNTLPSMKDTNVITAELKLDEKQLSILTDQHRINIINDNMKNKDYSYVLRIINSFLRDEDRDDQRMRCIDKLLKEDNAVEARNFIKQLELEHNKTNMELIFMQYLK